MLNTELVYLFLNIYTLPICIAKTKKTAILKKPPLHLIKSSSFFFFNYRIVQVSSQLTRIKLANSVRLSFNRPSIQHDHPELHFNSQEH